MKIDLICDHKVTLPSLDRCQMLSTAAVFNSSPSSPRHLKIFDPSSLRPLDLPHSMQTQTQYLCAAQGPESILRSSNSAVTHRTDHGEPSGSYLTIEKIARSHSARSPQPSQPRLLQARVPHDVHLRRPLSTAASLILSKPPHCLVHPLYRSQLRPVTCGCSFSCNEMRL